MAEPNEVFALEKITSEVDESQIKVILSSQCIKAQAFLAAKLRKQAQHLKETCGYISSANMKLQSEITHSEQKLQSMILAQDTIRMANVELKKQYLVAKERKLDVIDRMAIGESKYEEMWEESKSRYESLPFVQELLKAQEREQAIRQEIDKFENNALSLVEQIETKTKESFNLDRKRVVELAQYIVNELPKTKAVITEKIKLIGDLEEELKQYEIDLSKNNDGKNIKEVEQNQAQIADATWPGDNMCNLMMPKLHLPSLDFDVLSVQLDQVKIKRSNSSKIDIVNNEDWSKDVTEPKNNQNETVSYYFNEPIMTMTEDKKTENYSKKKLINILEDVRLDNEDAANLIAKVNIDYLNPVESIEAGPGNEGSGEHAVVNKKVKITKPIENEEIEEINMSAVNDILNPPSQFLDMTLIIQESAMEQGTNNLEENICSAANDTQPAQQDNSIKRVSFDLPATEDGIAQENVAAENNIEKNTENITETSQFDTSVISDDGFAKMKDMMLKKHNLDMSPQFVYYAKNIHAPVNMEEKTVTSKFFQQDPKLYDNNVDEKDNEQTEDNKEHANNIVALKKVVEMNIDEAIVSSPKRPRLMEMEIPHNEKIISGLLFNHGAQAIPESLDVSISTTGFEDVDADFPHCIDSSLLLSPKADVPIPMSGENPEVTSQDVPNFLSGLRKTGLSFFGRSAAPEQKPDSSAQPQPGFSFNFGGEDKKNRGGLFSMFK